MTSKDQLTVLECIRCGAFSISESLSFAEQHEQMKQHLDIAHAYWDLENLGAHAQTYKANFRRKARQRSEYAWQDAIESLQTNRTQLESLNKTSQRRQWFGILGSILLFIGVFAPIISVPIVGNVNYFQNGKGDGVIVTISDKGDMAMPVILNFEMTDGQSTLLKVPADIWFGGKRTYVASVPLMGKTLRSISLDPDNRFQDLNRDNNVWVAASAGVR